MTDSDGKGRSGALLDRICQELAKRGVRDLASGEIEGVCFDLVGSKRRPWKEHVVVQILPTLDDCLARKWKEFALARNARGPRIRFGTVWVVCLIVEDIEKVALDTVLGAGASILDAMKRFRNGGVLFVVVDLSSQRIHDSVRLWFGNRIWHVGPVRRALAKACFGSTLSCNEPGR